VRQTVLSGAVDSSGLPNFGGSTGGTTVTQTGGNIIVTAANGFDSTTFQAVNRTGLKSNPSWTGLSTNGTMYLGVTVNADGTLTEFSTTLAPTYQWGGAYSTTANQRTFNIQEMVMKVGNGATASQAYDVFVGEVTVAAGVVSAITWYALMGRHTSKQTGLAVNTTYSWAHNTGYPLENLLVSGDFLDTANTKRIGFAIGGGFSNNSNYGINTMATSSTERNVIKIRTGTTAFGSYNDDGGTLRNPTTGDLTMKFTRAW
jgi:hypothetical protein